MDLVKVISTTIDNLSRRIVKVLRFGKSDVQTAFEANAFGIDSNAVKDLVAVYSPTSLNGKTVIIGYINKNQLAGVGETRLYSTDEDGLLQFYMWLRNNGTLEIGGNSDNAVRYMALNTAFQTYLSALNAAIAAGVTSGGGTYTPPTSLDISSAKIDEIKTL